MADYVLDAKESTNPPVGALAQRCGRISVILGANGSGKTRFIYRLMGRYLNSELKNSFLYVEGNRVFMDKIITIDRNNETLQYMENPKQFEDNYVSRRRSDLTHRIEFSLRLLKLRSRKERETYVELTAAWAEAGRQGEPPAREPSSLQRAFTMFNQIFPDITLKESNDTQLVCVQGGHEYTAPEASDGEKQVLGLIFDLLLNKDADIRVIVDEPEAHMNPLLACDVWSVIEAHMPEAQFIYATHSVLFALRPSVESLFVMDKATYQPKAIDKLADVPSDELEKFLGSIPYVLSKKIALGVEGSDTSFDASFYRWLLGRNDIAIVPLGDRNKVLGETERLGLLRNIAPNAKILGVVDGDFKPAMLTQQAGAPSVLILDYHEAESYLCHPDVVAALAEKIIGKPPNQTATEVSNKIVDFAQANSIKIVGWRSFARLSFNLHPSIASSALAQVQTIAALTKAVQSQAANQCKVAQETLSAETIDKAIQDEAKKLGDAITAKNIDVLLKLLPGKELLYKLIGLAGMADVDSFLAGCSTNLDPSKFQSTKELRDKITKAIA